MNPEATLVLTAKRLLTHCQIERNDILKFNENGNYVLTVSSLY